MIGGWEGLRDRRLVLVVAAAGYGKSTAVRSWLAGEPVVWSTGGLPDRLPDPAGADRAGWVVVDDVAVPDAAAARALSASLDAVPPGWQVALLLRRPPAGDIGRRSAGPAAVVGAADLALAPGQVADLLGHRPDPELAERVHELTAGWPALVKLAGHRLAAAPPPVDRLVEVLARPGTALARYVERDILAPLPGDESRVLRDAAHLEYVCGGLLGERRRAALDHLVHSGLLIPAELPTGTYRFDPDVPAGPWYRPVPLVAAIVRGTGPPPTAGCRRRWRAAAGWCRQHHLHGHAARLLLAAGDPAACVAVLRERGEQVVAAGGAALVVATVRALPPELLDERVRLVFGEALALVGENDAALAELSALAGGTGPVDPAVAWRHGAVHYQKAERDAALAALARGRADTGRTRDEAMLLAQSATVHWSVGAAADCRALAERALQVAVAAGDHRAMAAARVAMALHAVLVGDRSGNAEHYDAALRHAELGRDAVQLARIRANRASSLLEEARFPAALAAAGLAVTAAEASGQAAILALALVNEAEALMRSGRLAEAEQRYQRAVSIHQRAGSHKVAYPLAGLGDLHARRGAWGLARAAYEEAVRAADADGFQQCLVPALAGLARVVAAGDPPAGRRLASRAVERATGPLRTRALLAAGWVEIAAADRRAAATAARAAAGAARRHRDRAGLAEALELLAFASDDPAGAADNLREAGRTWLGTGSGLDADRVAFLLARLPGATGAERLAGQLAQARLDEAGAVPPDRPAAPEVVIRTLGRFEVVVAGRVVPTSGWQSRKARDLLRILVARRGRMLSREELGTLLWADDDSARVSHRLSVALSTLRSVLDPDRRAPAGHYLVATTGGVRLDLAHLTVDVESFLASAALGLRLYHRDEPAGAYAVLAAAEQGYPGDFCEDDPYQDWSAPTREEARAAYLRVLRALADVTRQLDRVDEAIGYLLRILHLDRYDESGHCELVALLTAAGRHGEARRAQVRYLAAMRELGLPPRRSAPGRTVTAAEVAR